MPVRLRHFINWRLSKLNLRLFTTLAVSCTALWFINFGTLTEANSIHSTPAQSVEQRIKKLHDLLNEQWEYVLRTSPEFASIIGDKRYNDKLSDFSQAAIDSDLRQTRIFLQKFEAIDTTGFPEQEQLNRDLMVRNLRQQLEAAKFKEWEMPVTQFGGIHIDAAQLVSSLSFSTVKDYEDYIARLKQMPRAFAETMIQMRNGMKDGLMPPKILLVQVAEQAEGIAKQKPEETPFAEPTKTFPKEFSEADQARLRTGIIAAIRDQVLPTYKTFLSFVRNEYAPAGRNDIGLWWLPQGAERYALAVRRQTTTKMTPEEIHQLGLREVARIEAEQTAIAKKLGFSDLKSFKESLKKNPDVHAKSRQQILDEYRTYTDQMWKQLPEMFGRLPKAKLEILPVEAFREKTASTSYNQGTPDGSRPGHVFVNTYDYENQLTINNEDTAYHEGVPGHHMQISIAQELPDLPPFRQQAGYTAYVEGWALYCEGLGKEMGFYQNPYNDYGRLDDEMWRAARLVVDTGIHYKKWTREQVVQYLRDHSSQNEAYFQAETDRYIAWPGQALAYKIGQLTILRLREKARAELGPKFDIRAFHDEALGAGALPMDVFEQRINSWIDRVKRGANTASG
ncbi:MAG TPA: DUF885 domain-containing protein [Blastocatellia bacterium]|nr:DUF885 domain-containing protein [Blastocatellia bacterium]